MAAIYDSFGPLPNVQAENFLDDKRMSQLGKPPYGIAMLVKIHGVTSEDTYALAEMPDLAGDKFPFTGLAGLNINKRSPGRYKDLGDLQALELLHG